VKGLVERGLVGIDEVRRAMSDGVIEQGAIFWQGEGIDVAQGLDERGAKAFQRAEQSR
jgi:hypothetical protein